MTYSTRLSQLLESMTLAQKVGQIFVFTWKNEQQAINDLCFHPGGYIRIYSDVFSVARQTRMIQELSAIPLIIAADLERGIGGTIGGPVEVVTCMALGATNDEKASYDAGRIIAEEAYAMGINMNYVPVLDVNNNAANPVINTRSFGADPYLVSRIANAFAAGMSDGGLAVCGKHFPGHGNTHTDSHSHLGKIAGSRQQLEETELVPFRSFIATNPDAIMSAHLVVPALDPDNLPATLSHKIMTDLLRTELGFTGVATTDALDMSAVADNYPVDIAIPMAINAGCDQIIMPREPQEAVNALLAAVEAGKVSEARIDEAVLRILRLKEIRGILEKPLPDLENLHQSIATPAHIARASEIAQQSITLVKDDGNVPVSKNKNVLCIQISNSEEGRATFQEPRSFTDYLVSKGYKVSKVEVNERSKPDIISEEHLAMADVVIIAAYINVRLYSGSIALPEQVRQILKPVEQCGKPVIVGSFGSPYIINQMPFANSYLCAYSPTQPSQQAMANAIAGSFPCTGKLPVALS